MACPCLNLSFSKRVVNCRDFILFAVATFWAESLVGINPGRASVDDIKILCAVVIWK